jgi:hypothetical protein
MYWHFARESHEMPVFENNAHVEGRVRQAIADCDHLQFGRELHALQDSYSHSGVPPMGYFIPNAWGHSWRDSETEGEAWRSHDADDAWRRPDLAMRMATQTYAYMRDFVEECFCENMHLFVWRIAIKEKPFRVEDFAEYWQEPTADD